MPSTLPPFVGPDLKFDQRSCLLAEHQCPLTWGFDRSPRRSSGLSPRPLGGSARQDEPMDEVRNPRRCEILVLEIGGRRYGLPASEVRELLRVVTVESLPRAPPSIEGIINLRGKIVPVLDIRARLRLPPKPAEPSDYLVVIGLARVSGRHSDRPGPRIEDSGCRLCRGRPLGPRGPDRRGEVARRADALARPARITVLRRGRDGRGRAPGPAGHLRGGGTFMSWPPPASEPMARHFGTPNRSDISPRAPAPPIKAPAARTRW